MSNNKEGIMKKSSLLIVCFIALFVVAATGIAQEAEKIDLTGTWNLSVQTPSGQTGSPIFVLKQTGDKLTGTYQGFFGDAPVTGTVTGKEFEMTYTMQGQTTVYKGKTDGKNMVGKIDFAGQGEGSFTGKKK